MTYSWQNEEGEPIMSGEAWRFEQQLDYDSAMERWGDGSEFYDYDEDESSHDLDYDDLNQQGIPWCYGCDDYATNCDDNPEFYNKR